MTTDLPSSVPGALDLPGVGLVLLVIGSFQAGNPTYETLDGATRLSYADAMTLASQKRRGRNPGLYPERRIYAFTTRTAPRPGKRSAHSLPLLYARKPG